MKHPKTSALNAPDRLQALRDTELLDTAAEETFDRSTRLAAQILNVPVAMVSLVDDKRQFFKSCTGEIPEPWASQRGTPVSHAFCKYVVMNDSNLVVNDAREDQDLKHHPGVKSLGIIAYLGIPLKLSSGHTIGSFCTIDSQPREWTQEQIKTMEDLAASVIAEIELRVMVRELQKNNFEMRNIEMRRDELSDLMVNDLHNPLCSVTTGIELALSKCEHSKMQRQFLEAALENSQALTRMVDTILDQGQDDRGQLELKLHPVDLHRLLKESISQVQASASNKHVRLQVISPTNLPPVQADEKKMGRVLTNLLTNSIKHTPINGSVSCSIEQTRKDNKNRLQLNIRDEGSSIPQKFRNLVFDKYSQIEAGLYNFSSAGLGMPLCRVVIEGTGGDIWIESQLTKGTTYCISLPTEEASPDASV